MSRKQFELQMQDGVKITAYKWDADFKRAKGVVLILHGMAEHALRYEAFANYLNERKYRVYACDHRGHGRTGIENKDLGCFPEEGWQRLIDDIYLLVKKIKEENKDLPVVLLGHSMGSILARSCMHQFGNAFDGVVLSGTTVGSNSMKRKSGLIFAKLYGKRYGNSKEAKLLDELSFGHYNKIFKPNKTKFDWLSRDVRQVEAYVADDLCGFIGKSTLFINLLKGIASTIDKKNINEIPKDLPLFIFSGEKDPVGGNTKDVKKVYKAYRSAGIKNIRIKCYKEGRHEMLNELNREEVYLDIVTWIADEVVSKNINS